MFADLGIGFFGGQSKSFVHYYCVEKVFALKRRRYVT